MGLESNASRPSLYQRQIETQFDELKVYENIFKWPRGQISPFYCRRKI